MRSSDRVFFAAGVTAAVPAGVGVVFAGEDDCVRADDSEVAAKEEGLRPRRPEEVLLVVVPLFDPPRARVMVAVVAVAET